MECCCGLYQTKYTEQLITFLVFIVFTLLYIMSPRVKTVIVFLNRSVAWVAGVCVNYITFQVRSMHVGVPISGCQKVASVPNTNIKEKIFQRNCCLIHVLITLWQKPVGIAGHGI